MGQEEWAALLNNVASDDRTLLLGELPANMTRQLLTRLSQEERAVAVSSWDIPSVVSVVS
jgi:Mg/Co/Ni transporter MgtE